MEWKRDQNHSQHDNVLVIITGNLREIIILQKFTAILDDQEVNNNKEFNLYYVSVYREPDLQVSVMKV